MAPFLHLGPVTIPTYGLMVALGMLAAYYVLRADLARRGIAAQDSGMAELFIAVPGIAGIIGAKLYSVLETPRDFFADPFGQLFSRFGLTWYGGMVAGAATFAWLARRKKIPLLRMLDAGSPAASLGYAFGRMGCLLSGDGDYGIPTSLPWGMSFPNGLVPTTDHVHPTPIYESIVACLIAWVLWRLGARQIALGKIQPQAGPGSAKGGAKGSGAGQASSAGPPQGAIFGAYLALTGVARFLVEFIRINPRVLWGLTNAQIVGILCVIAGAVLWFRKERG